jgi:hypothetical protein
MRDAYASAIFACEATFFISATLRPADWERKKLSCSRFFGHDIREATDKSHTQHLIQYISYWSKGKVERRVWNIVAIDAQDAG